MYVAVVALDGRIKACVTYNCTQLSSRLLLRPFCVHMNIFLALVNADKCVTL